MIDLGALRQKLAAGGGRDLWRSFDELAQTDEFLALLHHEFPRQMRGLAAGVDRRRFLQLMGASLALAGLNACTVQPEETIVPYVKQPEGMVLGEALHFATAIPQSGYAMGVLVESHEGRPTKIEGNTLHPASFGGSDPQTQAEILSLYDPARSQTITSAGAIRPWSALVDALTTALGAERPGGGAGVRLLTETVTSPTLAKQIAGFLDAYPKARWHQWEAFGRDDVRAGARRAFGEPVETRYDLLKADVIVTLDADLFGTGPSRLRYAREFARRRRPDDTQRPMNRLYAVEPMPTTTGAQADHRLALRAGAVEAATRALAAGVGVRCAPGDAAAVAPQRAWIDAMAKDLAGHHGTSVVIAGEQQPPAVHALAHAINAALDNVGRTVLYTDAVEAQPVDQASSLRDLVADMEAGRVQLLVILGGNPVFTAPADLDFSAKLDKVPLRVHLGAHDDETAERCHWHVPLAHPLESWTDARADDGVVTIVQPLIAPLSGGRTAHEVMAALAGKPAATPYDVVREYWKGRYNGRDFDGFWQSALRDGVVGGSALPTKNVVLRGDWDKPTPPAKADGLEIAFRPDPYLRDGGGAGNGWLLELTRPITKLTWDNAALLAPATAERLGVDNEDVVELSLKGRVVRAPLWIVPGHAPDAVTVQAGFGRRRGAGVGTGAGFDPYVLRTSDALDVAQGLAVRKTGERIQLATTQEHQTMEGRPVALSGTVAEYRAHPDFARERAESPPKELTLYPDEHPYTGYAWGMAIDLSACIGCNACTLACQAENNIPVVGKDEVLRGHEMNWIRVDRYYGGALDDPTIIHQPVPCMHCENAPCEVVCPVNATVHDSEGLNVMVYNRCVGTRYCSNNCPYKVRRFNFFLYQDWTTEGLTLARNPDVSVRSRGVMEKCTYCVQRIERSRLVSAREGRAIRDGEVMTACQQACPAEAIVFGDINDPASRVARLKADPRNYALLGELNTRPRTTYLARVQNPNPALGEHEG